ncbi:hypothetical protein OEZ83_27010, partial [Leclercia adecarboxylata]|uniref:hypothetical protein n=1 Tax=Leclercia adecarboxylata TaxID=83655 RepID=UPI00234D571E
VHVAKEMQRRGMDLPLLIGGATTSKAHTAVKIEPQYDHPVIYVTDASRAVGVAGKLLTPALKTPYVAEIREEYEKVRERNAKRRPKAADLDYTQARKRRFRTDWNNHTPAQPNVIGLKSFDNYD